VCPDCASRGALVVREAIRYHGNCRAILIHRTTGRVLAAAIQGSLKYLYEENGAIHREDGAKVVDEVPRAGMGFAISGPTTWLGWGARLVGLAQGRAPEVLGVGTMQGAPVFDATAAGVVRLDGEWLVEGTAGGGRRLGRALEGHTWIRAGEHLGLGFYRAGLATFHFLFTPGRPGLRDLRVPPIEGRLVEVHAVFDDDAVALCYAVEVNGRRRVSLFVVAADGRVLGRLEGEPTAHRALGAVRGKVLSGGTLLAITEDGLVSLEPDRASGLLVERTLFSDTEPFVELGAELLPGPAGSVYVVTPKEITQLVLA
jgi:hypothetical protein